MRLHSKGSRRAPVSSKPRIWSSNTTISVSGMRSNQSSIVHTSRVCYADKFFETSAMLQSCSQSNTFSATKILLISQTPDCFTPYQIEPDLCRSTEQKK